ncbi:Anaerobic dehydrogenases, typically selenocysteine-containing [hydrothermal vent metagenome]|uniref:Anaerobic dehydrogenases, typically selenocysteine-containing n=1 Tax=hydrothermal vent metagenome TaxID=652676 RepID=A0A1W1BFJ8_9ZZZZ
MIETACALDCPDACGIVVDPQVFPRLQADTNNGTLCSLLNRDMFDTPRIEKPTIDGVEVSMDEALDEVAKALKEESLLWRGSGNFAVMQEVTNLLFEKIGGTLTTGTLCDGAGDAGIIEGRGVNRTLPLEQIEMAETIVVWGRNPSTTNSHIVPYLKDKKIVVIDPIATPLAKKADLHIQIKPRSDIYLALMLSRFIFMEDSEDSRWLEEFAPEFEEFYEFTREFRIKAILAHIGIDLGDMGRLISYIQGEKVLFLVGNGIQKYSTGHYTMWAIDSLAATLGLFGKDGSGVSYIGNSKLGFDNPFDVKCKSVSKVDTPFDRFKTVLVQGGNPAESMPNSSRVIDRLERVENLIYFGLYENKTSQMAKVVIPAKSFFEKDDIRLSYGSHIVRKMNRAIESDIGISEYDFCKSIYDRFGFDGLQSEEQYIEYWLKQCREMDGLYYSPAYESHPYRDGFGADSDDEFIFIDEFEDTFETLKHLQKYRKLSDKKREIDSYWLITPKAKHALNTQFKRDNIVILNPALGYDDGDSVLVSSPHGSFTFVVKNSIDTREDSIVIRANTIGVNYLTPSIISEEGEGACYQEVKVTIERVVL